MSAIVLTSKIYITTFFIIILYTHIENVKVESKIKLQLYNACQIHMQVGEDQNQREGNSKT